MVERGYVPDNNNRVVWDDVNLEPRFLHYTGRKKGGHLTPREVPLTIKLHETLSRRFQARDQSKSWVFWHSYRDGSGKMKEGPDQDRKRFMRTLCRKVGGKHFRFHALRHAGASVMDADNVPIGSIHKGY